MMMTMTLVCEMYRKCLYAVCDRTKLKLISVFNWSYISCGVVVTVTNIFLFCFFGRNLELTQPSELDFEPL